MTRQRRRRFRAGAALATLAICTLACGREEAPAPPPEAPAVPVAAPWLPPLEPVPAAPRQLSAADPVSLPDDLPLYAGAIPVSSMASPDRGTIVNLRSTDAAAQVFDWYCGEFPKRGWILEKQSGTGSLHLVTALKTGRKASVLITSGAADAEQPVVTQILLTLLEAR